MPKTFETHFTHKEKPPQQARDKEKSPEQIKEEQSLELIREIKETKERMEKEGKTVEGYQKIIELIQKIKEIYEEKPEITSWEEIERLEEIFSKDFEKSIYHPTFSPSGKEIIVREGFGGLRIYKIIGKKRK